MSRRLRSSLISLALGWVVSGGAVASAQPAPVPANQLVVSGNACGPTALLNAFRFGSPDWQRAEVALSGENDKQRITSIIRECGMRPSNHLQGRVRWSRKGVNLADLCDIANDMTRGKFLPTVNSEVLFLTKNETPEALLKRAYGRFKTSLTKGLPPVLSLRRYVRRAEAGKAPQWLVVDAHFVTLTAIPGKWDRSARSFPVTYIDPWGGKICQGVISISDRSVLAAATAASPCLEADFPAASVGKKFVRPGETTALTVAAVLGRW